MQAEGVTARGFCSKRQLIITLMTSFTIKSLLKLILLLFIMRLDPDYFIQWFQWKVMAAQHIRKPCIFMVVPPDFKDLLSHKNMYFYTAPLLGLHVIWEVWCLMWYSEIRLRMYQYILMCFVAGDLSKTLLLWSEALTEIRKRFVCFLIFRGMNYPATLQI